MSRRSSHRMPPISDPVAARIRALRIEQGLTYKRLSEALGVAASFIFNIERGWRVPNEEKAASIATALGDGAYEGLYRAWSRAKSRSYSPRGDHEVALKAWERLRSGFEVTDADYAGGAS